MWRGAPCTVRGLESYRACQYNDPSLPTLPGCSFRSYIPKRQLTLLLSDASAGPISNVGDGNTR